MVFGLGLEGLQAAQAKFFQVDLGLVDQMAFLNEVVLNEGEDVGGSGEVNLVPARVGFNVGES